MCGIAGFSGNIDGNKNEILKKMTDKIAHRGPDQEGFYINDDVALGFRRLSIIDLNNGSQPMFNENKDIAIVFNGEIYNHLSLREELKNKGHIFANNSDTEVLVHGYEEYGVDLLYRLRGMFAFMIYDSKKKLMFGARDFFGIKPFYYAMPDDNLVFGSEIKSILEFPTVKKRLMRLP